MIEDAIARAQPTDGKLRHFPLSLTERSEVVESDRMPNAERDAVCAGHRVEGGTGNEPAIYHALPTSMTNKVLVQLDCATHAMMWKGCSNARRCIPASGIPYGGPPDRPWEGPHATIKASLIEWITNGTFHRR